ncbi:MAG TPA: hypothetical protein DEE98_01650 [Elusimicrobia bacterium]|nr:MAG: hypothetical protein A2278_06065 [Elusimicrobia bacterium RIFOXYA12_FULL_49_49]OGS16643.1 MAG: hypothetical protein A2251_04670 [Elusimicrobia bacterium RIFOXYA2_FULL_47_53]OGS25492.1 MAG: hypothetical protein A2339_00245 [Elusimicrobia bacterium RIFOXYB12_FULL_50_12]OGS31621.1 MAG: hypothetical protein A2323_03390 [Elusimicrobia bacterium RIFOXYB2_FULL_46_23]HBU69068.1 hypothetical protein [Elusimicrobiota bacterium]
MIKNMFSPIKKGISLMRQDRYGEAVEYFLRMLKAGKNLDEAHFNLGRCFFKIGLFKECKEHLLETLKFRLSDDRIRDILEITNWRQLVSNKYFNSSPSFSHDGSKIVYVSSRRDTNNDGKIDSLDCGGVYVCDLSSGEERYIVSDDYYNSHPVFSPDGNSIAYLSSRLITASANIPERMSNPGLYLINVETGEESLLLDNSYRIKNVSFSSDGEKLIFSSWRPGDNFSGIYSLELKTRKFEALVSGMFDSTFPVLSPSGTRVMFSSWRNDTNADGVIDIKDNSAIYIKNLLIGFETLIAPDTFNNSFPAFSRDESKVMYLSVRRDTNSDNKIDSTDNAGIYVYDMEKQHESCVVDDASFNKFAGFTPDGKSIVFISSWRINRPLGIHDEFFENKGIYVINVDGKKIRQIVSDKYYGSRSTVVSPKGDSVVYVSWRRNTSRGIYQAYLRKLPSVAELKAWIEKNIIPAS